MAVKSLYILKYYVAVESVADLRAKLDAYRLQLNQVVAILVSDPENAQFRQLKTDLDTVIKLTEELIRSREEDATTTAAPASLSAVGSSPARVAANAAAPGGAPSTATANGSPFSVGQVVEATSGDRPYAAVILAVSPEAGECTLKYFEFDTPVVLPFKEIAKIKGSLTAAQVCPGFVGQVKYATDQRWYDAVVDAATEHGYRVTYSAYGNTEEVPLEYIRAPLLKKERSKDENALISIPDNLKILPTDTEEEKARKKKKIKAIKTKNKERTAIAQINETQQTWKSFVAKGTKSKRPLPGLSALKNEKSIFASSDSVDAKVGVVGSGQGMTEYGDRKRHKFSALGQS